MNFYPFLLQALPEVQLDSLEVAQEPQNIVSIIFSSGPLGIIISVALFLLSIYAMYIFIERYMSITKAGKIDQSFMANIRKSVQNGNIESAKALCSNTDTPVARMIEKGLARIGKPMNDINAAIDNIGNIELIKLEKNLSTLATISGAAPMIGFFGTVTGMISAFREMSLSENITPDVLAGGIYQALLTTAFGLFVGIISFVGYNYLVAAVEKVIFQMEARSSEFMDLLQEPA
ncbi:MAG: biopolymer transport protein ExbB [Cognaticolwellia sp.]|jgi:biopolymer transport protein ExbB